jgi:hypothetical protein
MILLKINGENIRKRDIMVLKIGYKKKDEIE